MSVGHTVTPSWRWTTPFLNRWVGADGALEVVDEREHLFIGRRPVEFALLVLDDPEWWRFGCTTSQTSVVGDAPVYVAPSVSAVRALWDRSGGLAGSVIRQQLSSFAVALIDAHAAGEESAAVLVRNWSDGGQDAVRSVARLPEAQAQLIAARDHGFTSWSSVAGESDPTFELAVDAVVHGRIDELRAMLTDHPDLAVRRSAYGHRATLLHYMAANGVEIRRQLVPANAAEVVATLLGAGADRSATLWAYRGQFDVLEMLKSSAHPHDARVAAALERALVPD